MEHVVYEQKNLYLQDCYTCTFMIRTRKNQELFRLFLVFWIVSTILTISRHQSYSFRIC